MLVGTQQDAFSVCQPKRQSVHFTQDLHGLGPRVLRGEGIGLFLRRPFRLSAAGPFRGIGALEKAPSQIIQLKALFLRAGMLQRQETALDGRHLKETLQENVPAGISVKTALPGAEGKIGDIALFQACPLPPDHRQI